MMESVTTCPACDTALAPELAQCPACGSALSTPGDVAGRLLRNGEFRLLRRLERGGMATLYLAEVVATGERRVVKELRPGADRQARATLEQMFRDEAALLAHLNRQHLAVPQYYDSFMDSGAFYMVIEHVPGENLARYIEHEGGRLPVLEAIDLAQQAVAVLVVLHALPPHPVIHGDIKPANLIRRPDGRAVLIDFGLSHVHSPMPPYVPAGASNFGTPGYTPTEQWEGRPGPASDVFALGATLHHVISGRSPLAALPGYTRFSRADLSVLMTFPPLSSLIPEPWPLLDQLLAQMLQRRAADRPSIQDVQARLARIGSLRSA